MSVAETSPLERPAGPASVTPLQWEVLRSNIAERYGFWLNDSWSGQVVARLVRRVEATGRSGIDDYLLWLRGPGGDGELAALVETLLNGETHFLRTEPHFAALLSKVLPAWRETRSRGQRLRIASLGCSTGEEPYSIALVLHENLSEDELADVEITGLDLNSQSLAVARAGSYDAYALRDLSFQRRERWFRREGDRWVIDAGLRASVRFLQHNLLEPLPFAGLDVIFCRNVLIYFRRPVVAFCFREIHAALRPGGYLFLGHAESAFGFPEFFEPVQVREGVIYQNKPSLSF